MPRKGRKKLCMQRKGHNRKYNQKLSQHVGDNDAGVSFESLHCDQQSYQQSLTESACEIVYPIETDVSDNDTGVSFESLHSAQQLSTRSVYPKCSDASCQTYSAEVTDSICQTEVKVVASSSQTEVKEAVQSFSQTDPDHLNNESVSSRCDELFVKSLLPPTQQAELKDGQLSLPKDWVLTQKSEDCVHLIKLVPLKDAFVTKFNVIISSCAPFVTIHVHRKPLPEIHQLYQQYRTGQLSCRAVCTLLNDINKMGVCYGNPDFTGLSSYGSKSHLEPYFGETYEQTIRSNQCDLLCPSLRCKECIKTRQVLRAYTSRKRHRSADKSASPSQPSSRAPLKHLSCDQLKKRLKSRTKQTKNLRARIERLKEKLADSIQTSGETLNQSTSDDLQQIVQEHNFESDSFQALFWEQQKKVLETKDSRGMRWHPMMIRFALSLKFKSSSAYDAIRRSGCISLPSKRTLQDYTHVFKTKSGLQSQVFNSMLAEREKESSDNAFYVLLHDELRVKSDLIFDKNTGELVGYVDLGEVGNQMNDLQRSLEAGEPVAAEVAKYILVLMVRSLTSNFKYVIGHFPCAGIKSEYLFPIVWDAIEHLECLHFKVLCVTCDGATPNRKFFKLHRVAGNADAVVYKTENPWAENGRPLFFMSDSPHLMKTTRNCFSNSFSHKQSRAMWRNGQYISWRHIINLYNGEATRNLRLVPKLKKDHVYLTSFSVMKVSFAAQVLSETVANALSLVEPESEETVKFIRMFDKFFDCMNVGHLYRHEHARKPFLRPYTSVNDARFAWLIEDFLGDLAAWKAEVEARPGPFSKTDRGNMMLSHQTLEGIEITVKSFVEACQYLLNHGVQFVLSEKFNQDSLEEYFSLQRSAGGSNNNPTVNQFNFNAASLRIQKSSACAPFTGNCRRNGNDAITVDEAPLPKRKR